MNVSHAVTNTITDLKAAKTGTTRLLARNAVRLEQQDGSHHFPSVAYLHSTEEKPVAAQANRTQRDAARPDHAAGKINEMEKTNASCEKNTVSFQTWIRGQLPDENGTAAVVENETFNIGNMKNADGYGKICGICGDTMEIWLKINDGIIADASFLTDGCFSSQVCGSAATFLAKGEMLIDALRISPASIMDLMRGLHGVELHCSILATSTLYRAIADFLLKTEDRTWDN